MSLWLLEVEQKKSNHIMGQKTNPIGNRLGYIKGWDSNWFGGRNYGDKIAEDSKIRQYIGVRLAKASVAKVVIERTLKMITITIHTARPGIIIGKGGSEVDKLREELKKITEKLFQLKNKKMPYLQTDSQTNVTSTCSYSLLPHTKKHRCTYI